MNDGTTTSSPGPTPIARRAIVIASVPFATRQLFPAVDPNGNLIPSSDIQAQIASLQGHYNGMGIKVEKRAGYVNLVSSYTWSHKLDNWAASGLSYGNNGRPSYPDYNKINKGNGDLDVRHRWASGFVLQAPFGRGQRFASGVNHAVNLIVSGWQVAANGLHDSGNHHSNLRPVSSARTFSMSVPRR